MPYSTSNPPRLLVGGTTAGNGASIWTYTSVDAATVVRVAGYITNAKTLGIKVGDVVFATDTDASPPVTTLHSVITVNATTGVADLSDGVSLGANTD